MSKGIDAISFVDEYTFWFLVDDQLHRTSDGGRTFTVIEPQFSPPKARGRILCSGMWLRSQSEAWGVCDDRLFRTVDGGSHWKAAEQPDPAPRVFQVSMFDQDVGIAVGWGLLRTANGGRSWQEIEKPFSDFAKEISCASTGFCALLASTRGPLLITSDRGLTWSDAEMPLRPGRQDQIWRVHAFAPDKTMAVGYDTGFNVDAELETYARGTPAPAGGGLILKWDGSGWTRIIHPKPQTLSGAYFVDENNGWLFADWNEIYKTTDGGQTLQFVPDYFRQLHAPTATAQAEQIATMIAGATATAEAEAEQTPAPEETP
jgi:photosystem II stability/assembly factor-like uncharacterized protein